MFMLFLGIMLVLAGGAAGLAISWGQWERHLDLGILSDLKKSQEWRIRLPLHMIAFLLGQLTMLAGAILIGQYINK